jgi:hypothetical protein
VISTSCDVVEAAFPDLIVRRAVAGKVDDLVTFVSVPGSSGRSRDAAPAAACAKTAAFIDTD